MMHNSVIKENVRLEQSYYRPTNFDVAVTIATITV